jgi:hypothetical protein
VSHGILARCGPNVKAFHGCFCRYGDSLPRKARRCVGGAVPRRRSRSFWICYERDICQAFVASSLTVKLTLNSDPLTGQS